MMYAPTTRTQTARLAAALAAGGAILAGVLAVSAAHAQARADRNLTVSAAPAAAAVNSTQRVALVIGNGSYKDSPSPELRAFVAREWNQSSRNNAPDIYRIELTSFEVSGYQPSGN